MHTAAKALSLSLLIMLKHGHISMTIRAPPVNSRAMYKHSATIHSQSTPERKREREDKNENISPVTLLSFCFYIYIYTLLHTRLVYIKNMFLSSTIVDYLENLYIIPIKCCALFSVREGMNDESGVTQINCTFRLLYSILYTSIQYNTQVKLCNVCSLFI